MELMRRETDNYKKALVRLYFFTPSFFSASAAKRNEIETHLSWWWALFVLYFLDCSSEWSAKAWITMSFPYVTPASILLKASFFSVAENALLLKALCNIFSKSRGISTTRQLKNFGDFNERTCCYMRACAAHAYFLSYFSAKWAMMTSNAKMHCL